ncbi:RsmD family RNA methyltransferase [Verrucomicrobia bacterium]|nr:RsmD family RNA methyltransferase [Verrucomicrobiota bacterium]
MRIISGKAAGFILKTPKGLDVRPTPDLHREAIFNCLGELVIDADILELFAGVGSLSLECLSRGSKSATCVELSPKHGRIIQENWKKAKLTESPLRLYVKDAFLGVRQIAASNASFDLILADPPYGPKNVKSRSRSLAQKALDDEQIPKLLKPGGIFLIGHTKRDTLEVPSVWSEKKFMRHGDTCFRFLTPSSI